MAPDADVDEEEALRKAAEEAAKKAAEGKTEGLKATPVKQIKPVREQMVTVTTIIRLHGQALIPRYKARW